MKIPFRWIWRNRIGYMIYAKEVGTKLITVRLVRVWRIRWMGKHYGPFKVVDFEAINRHYHLSIGQLQFSVMPVKPVMWHNF